jgi:hypothetical protein
MIQCYLAFSGRDESCLFHKAVAYVGKQYSIPVLPTTTHLVLEPRQLHCLSVPNLNFKIVVGVLGLRMLVSKVISLF